MFDAQKFLAVEELLKRIINSMNQHDKDIIYVPCLQKEVPAAFMDKNNVKSVKFFFAQYNTNNYFLNFTISVRVDKFIITINGNLNGGVNWEFELDEWFDAIEKFAEVMVLMKDAKVLTNG